VLQCNKSGVEAFVAALLLAQIEQAAMFPAWLPGAGHRAPAQWFPPFFALL
jgi:hypothetical protein